MPTPCPAGAIVARSARHEARQNKPAPHRIVHAQNRNHPCVSQGRQT
ncbi:MAG: hypothetical protein ABIF28_04010 [Pseudomonadota bacterium]